LRLDGKGIDILPASQRQLDGLPPTRRNPPKAWVVAGRWAKTSSPLRGGPWGRC